MNIINNSFRGQPRLSLVANILPFRGKLSSYQIVQPSPSLSDFVTNFIVQYTNFIQDSGLYQMSQTLCYRWVRMQSSTAIFESVRFRHELYGLNIQAPSKFTNSIEYLNWTLHTLCHPWVTMRLSTIRHELYDLNLRTRSKITKSIQHLYWISQTLYHPRCDYPQCVTNSMNWIYELYARSRAILNISIEYRTHSIFLESRCNYPKFVTNSMQDHELYSISLSNIAHTLSSLSQDANIYNSSRTLCKITNFELYSISLSNIANTLSSLSQDAIIHYSSPTLWSQNITIEMSFSLWS